MLMLHWRHAQNHVITVQYLPLHLAIDIRHGTMSNIYDLVLTCTMPAIVFSPRTNHDDSVQISTNADGIM